MLIKNVNWCINEHSQKGQWRTLLLPSICLRMLQPDLCNRKEKLVENIIRDMHALPTTNKLRTEVLREHFCKVLCI